jgi:Zn ribbon nucleic-acid-binding protein
VRIPIGTETTAVAKDTVSFRCVHCGQRARAAVTGIGEGMQSFLNVDGTARQRAREDARRDIGRTIQRAKCPSCHRRDPRGVWRFFQPYVIVVAVMMSAGFVLGYAPTWFDINMAPHDKAICAWVVPLIMAVSGLLVIPIPMLLKWSSTDRRVTWLADEPAAPAAPAASVPGET